LKFCESTKQIFCSATERILKHQNVSENKPKRKRSFIGGTVAGRVKAQRFLLILIGPHQVKFYCVQISKFQKMGKEFELI
jgi:hypothetical protein